MRSILIITTLAFLTLFFPYRCYSEIVLFKDGTVLDGKISYWDDSGLGILVNNSLREFSLSQVDTITNADGSPSKFDYAIQRFYLLKAIQQRRYGDVVSICNKLCVKLKEDKDVQYFCALARRFNGDDMARLAGYEKLVEEGYARPEVLNDVAYSRVIWGQEEQAQKLFEESLRINPKDKIVLKNLALIYLKKSDWKAAKEVLFTLVEMEPQNPLFLYNLGITYMGLEKFQEAEYIWRKMLVMDPALTYPKEALLFIEKKGSSNAP
ncbi:MAG: tetratricopeptide repeat protein [Candidatus Omnitrophica bacterium]|nr:tetratricopeptide repeat protein [Candidatus Omnitrophota bacterium]